MKRVRFYSLFRSILLATIFFIYLQIDIRAQNPVDAIETCTDPHIKTILLYRSGWDLSMPVIYSNENESLNLDFDYLDSAAESYNYSIINCMSDWKLNDASERDYIVGFNDVSINDISHSLNTTRSYTHFAAAFPNDELKLFKSGNYLLRVYKNGEPDKVILTRKFCIAENLVDISAVFKQPDKENQEINLEVNLANLQVQNPLNDIKVVILKNYDWNNKVDITSFALLQDNKLVFNMPYQISLAGGNEFRYFDIKSIKFISERVSTVRFLNPDYHIFLKADELKQFKQYVTSKDLNSRYYIDATDAHKRYVEADYVYVHFTLNAIQPIASDVYIYGALSNYTANKSNSMEYDPVKSVYEKTLLLKQGYYNYAYATRDQNKKKLDFDITEGIHSETENDYAVFVYLKDAMSDFDRLVGFKIINSAAEIK